MLLNAYRFGQNSRRTRYAHIVLLLADGLSWRQVRQFAYASNDLISDRVKRFRDGGIELLLTHFVGRYARKRNGSLSG